MITGRPAFVRGIEIQWQEIPKTLEVQRRQCYNVDQHDLYAIGPLEYCSDRCHVVLYY